jgi:hypothetical protein
MTSDHGLKRGSRVSTSVLCRLFTLAFPLVLLWLLPTPAGEPVRLPPLHTPLPPSFPSCPPGDPTLSISNVFSGPSLVLQRSPASSRIWGWVHPSCGVEITFLSTAAGALVDAPTIAYHADGKWIASLPPIEGGTALYTFSVRSTSGGAVLNMSMRFGEVFFCGGQVRVRAAFYVLLACFACVCLCVLSLSPL